MNIYKQIRKISAALIICMIATIFTAMPMPSFGATVDANNGDWSAKQVTMVNTPEAEMMVRAGDIDNFGMGWPAGFSPFSGQQTNMPATAWIPPSGEPWSVDRLMVPTGYQYNYQSYQDPYTKQWTQRNADIGTGKIDKYTEQADRVYTGNDQLYLQYDNFVNHQTNEKIVVKNAVLQIYLGDFQPKNSSRAGSSELWNGNNQYTFTLNNISIPEIAAVINSLDQTGHKGQLITVPIPQKYIDNSSTGMKQALESGNISIRIDDRSQGATGDAFAIDFVKLLLNTKNTPNVSGGSIGGLIFYDLNGNGKYEPSDQLTGGVVVELYLKVGSSYVYQKNTTTTSNGQYTFTGLDSSKLYKVRVIPPPGASFTRIGNGRGQGVYARLSKVDSAGVKELIQPTDLDINAGLIGGTTPVTPPAPGPTPATLDLFDVSRNTTASNIQNGSSFDVNYTITPKSIPVSNATGSQQKDIVLVMDTSTSMKYVPWGDWEPYYYGEKSRLTIIEAVANNFVSKFQGDSKVNISLMKYNKRASTVSNFVNMGTGDVDSLKTAIGRLSTDDYTNTGDGLRSAYYALNNNNGHDKYIILMTDGAANTCSTTNADTSYTLSYDYFMNDGVTPYYSSTGNSDGRGLAYAKKVAAEQLAPSTINTFIVGFGATANYNNKQIADAAEATYYAAVDETSVSSIYDKMQKIIGTGFVASANFQEVVSPNLQMVDTGNLPYGLKQVGNQIQGTINNISYTLSPDRTCYQAQPITFKVSYRANASGNYILGDDNNNNGSSYVDYSALNYSVQRKYLNKLIVNGVILPEVGIQVTDASGNVGEKYTAPIENTNSRIDKVLNPSVYLQGDAYANMSVKGNNLDFFRYQFINAGTMPQTMPATGWTDMPLTGQTYNEDVETDKPGKLKWRGYDVNHMDTLTNEKSWSDPLQVFKYPSDATGYKPTNISTSVNGYGGWQSITPYSMTNIHNNTINVNKKWVTNSVFMNNMNITWADNSGTNQDYKEASKFWGYIKVPVSGRYQFGATSDDGFRGYITVDGETNAFADMFHIQGSAFGSTNQVYNLNAGQYYPIYLEYFNWGGYAELRMQYSSSGNVQSSSENVPADWFYPSKSNAPGEYAQNVFTGSQGVKLPTTPGSYYVAYQTGKGSSTQREGVYGPFIVENRLTLAKNLVGGGNIVQKGDSFSLQYVLQPQNVPLRDSFKNGDGSYPTTLSLKNIKIRDVYPQDIAVDTAHNQNIIVNTQVNDQGITVQSIEAGMPDITYTLTNVNGQQMYTASIATIEVPLKANAVKTYALSDLGKSTVTFTELNGQMEKQMEFPQFTLNAAEKGKAALSIERSVNKTDAYLGEPFSITYRILPQNISVPAGVNAAPAQVVRNVTLTETLPAGINVNSSSLPPGVSVSGQTITVNVTSITYTLNADKTAYVASPIPFSIIASSNQEGTYTLGEGAAGSYTNVDGTAGSVTYLGTNTITINKRPLSVPVINANEDWTNAAQVPVTITATINDPKVKIQYKLEGAVTSDWMDYSVGFNITQEGQTTISARTIDDVGNASEIATKTVKIDRTAPNISLEATPTTNTDKVTINAVVTDTSGVVLQKYAAGERNITYFRDAGTAADSSSFHFEVSENGIYTVYGKDTAGNEVVRTINIQNINGIEAPVVRVLAGKDNPVTWSSQDAEGKIFASQVAFTWDTIKDATITATLNRDNLKTNSYSKENPISEDGEYTLVVTAQKAGGLTASTTVHLYVSNIQYGIIRGNQYDHTPSIKVVKGFGSGTEAGVDFTMHGKAANAVLEFTAEGTQEVFQIQSAQLYELNGSTLTKVSQISPQKLENNKYNVSVDIPSSDKRYVIGFKVIAKNASAQYISVNAKVGDVLNTSFRINIVELPDLK